MGLQKYKQKRKFDETPEPEGKEEHSKDALKFVVQKHHASHLHYDFRLEMEGVMKSWAVPKGPSLNPEDKRLAMMVEDHPMSYRTFEGIIPEGNYGAGTVMVWDEGTYASIETSDRKEGEKALKKGLRSGRLSFLLNGKKLKGEFSLVKMNSRGENSWLLIKKDDKYASETDVIKKDKSVISKRSLEKIREESGKKGDVWGSNRKAASKKTSDKLKVAKPAKAIKKKVPDLDPDAIGATKVKFPLEVKPMLATLVDEAFSREGWTFEIKWDGFRTLGELNKGKVRLYSRNNLTFNKNFSPIAEAMEELPKDMLLDGEVVAIDDEGNSKFQLLQNFQRNNVGQLIYYVFDILYYDGYDLTQLPLTERKKILRSVLPEMENIKYSDHIEEQGEYLFEEMVKRGMEGVIAKKADSIYRIGSRSKDWLKIKSKLRQEAVICGYTQGRNSRKYFGALVLGLYDDKGELHYIGHSGGGFDQKSLVEVYNLLKPLETDKPPFKTKPKTNMPVQWLKPKLVCEVEFQEWTGDGAMRIPIFLGLRKDKKAEDVKRENPQHIDEKKKSVNSLKLVHKKNNKAIPAKEKKEPSEEKKSKGKSTEGDKETNIEGKKLKFTNLSKLYWKKERITKGELIDYYDSVSSYILPYLKDRPESLHRYPNGAGSPSFFQKDVGSMPPSWIRTEKIFSESIDKHINYLVCQDKPTLLYLANLGCIELNPWHSRLGKLDLPDYIIIDLDPHEISFKHVIETALVVKEVLDEAKIPAYCKTSGSTGIHIYIPMGAKYDYDQAKQFAEIIANIVHQRIPKITSVLRSPAKRVKKVYLDFLQNRKGQTIAAPYCVRPKPGATVSTPLEWHELQSGLLPSDFTIKNINDRLKKTGDLFKPVLGKGIDLQKSLKNLGTLFQ
jgi:bifunctional non-homologous end joining protein LigD